MAPAAFSSLVQGRPAPPFISSRSTSLDQTFSHFAISDFETLSGLSVMARAFLRLSHRGTRECTIRNDGRCEGHAARKNGLQIVVMLSSEYEQR